MRKILPLLLLAAAAVACAEPVLAQGMGGGGMGGGGMGGAGMGGGGRGGGHRRGGGGPGQGAPGAPPAGLPVAPTLSAADRLSGVLTVAAQAKSLAKATITAVEPDHSAAYVLRGGQLTLDSVDLVSSATATLPQGARTVGLASALLVYSHATATMTNGSVATTAKGTNAVYLSDPGSRATLKGVTVTTKASYAMGLVVTDGAKLDASALKVTTESDHAPALCLQDGQAILTGGTYATNGPVSPVIAAAGNLSASGITVTAAASSAMTIDGPRAVSLSQSSLTADDIGIALLTSADAQSPSGPPAAFPTDSPGGPRLAPVGETRPVGPQTLAHLTFQGGQLRSRRDALTVSNIKAAITLNQVDVQPGNGVILRAFAAQWGEMGRNGGDAALEARNQVLTGDFVTDVLSSITLSLRDGSTFTGRTTANVDVALDASSSWTLTADTRVGKLSDAAIAGDSVPNIIGNGHVLSYDARHNPALGGKTYALSGGGTLTPGSGL